jgi:hypothetical protein
MTPRLVVVVWSAVVFFLTVPWASAQGPSPRRPWTLEEALDELSLNPTDAYLQYVALQLAGRENRVQEVTARVQSLRGAQGQERIQDVDLFSMVSGALAIQESLQLDTMRGETPRRAQPGAEGRPRRSGPVALASLSGPTVQSHPWEQLLAGRQPEVSPLSRLVPEDFYLVEFRSLGRLLQAFEAADGWGTHLLHQSLRESRSHDVAERLKRQLAVETDPLARPFYDLVVEDVAITGSDLFAREGSDVTLIFRLKQPEVFRARMAAALGRAEKARPDARRTAGRHLDVDYVGVATPDREISVFAADPAPDLHLRSNSRPALERVLAAIAGRYADGQPVRRLGETAEYAYIRTLLPRGAPEEDGFVYLSDAFIRRLVGPKVKLTERRRMLCYNHLRMIGHGALLHRTETGRAPESLDALVRSRSVPGRFGEGRLACPDGGQYTLADGGMAGVCSVHGRARWLTPCLEIPLATVTADEAEEYDGFLAEYNQYWRTYFDPIALRIQAAPRRLRVETLVLPLIDNSIYTALAGTLGGSPVALDGLPVPRRNIFTVALRLDKERLISTLGDSPAVLDWRGLFARGLDDPVGLHVYDAPPTFDFNLPSFLGETMGTFVGTPRGRSGEMLWISFLVASLNAPVYVSVPVRDAAVVDAFLERLDAVLAPAARERQRGGFFDTSADFYRVTDEGATRGIRSYALSFGPLRFRFFWARIGDAVYLASRKFVLDDLAGLAPTAAPTDAGPAGHLMVRVRPENWRETLPDYRLGWAENGRVACLGNVATLAALVRAFSAGDDLQRSVESLVGVRFFCAENGVYSFDADGARCSVHGSPRRPRQGLAAAPGSDLARLLADFAGLTATLTFREEGLHAVLTLDRH